MRARQGEGGTQEWVGVSESETARERQETKREETESESHKEESYLAKNDSEKS